MASPVRQTLWLWWALFAGIVLALIFFRILPLGALAGRFPGPDLVMCLACAWVIRRPDLLPALVIAGAVLLEDMVLMRPPGLWAALMILGTEVLRTRSAFSRELSFLAEWAMVAVVMFAMVLGNRLIMAAMILPQPGFGMQMIGFAFSVLAYPAVVLASRLLFGLYKPATGEVDAMGRRL